MLPTVEQLVPKGRLYKLDTSGIFPRSSLLVLLIFGFHAAPALAIPASSAIEWQSCFQEAGPFECTTVEVPLVHDAASGEDNPMISIAMTRLPASDPERRIGTLFFNPGGPGGSGIDFLLDAGPQLYTDEVRARYDLVGFDPRGIGFSNALTCRGTSDLLTGVLNGLGSIQKPFPDSLEDIVAKWIYDRALVTSCKEQAGAIIDHMTTADVARDLDLLRQSVGDEQLNFVGYSYGSYLGVTYANLFPDRVGALVIDGIIDPVAWATGHNGEHATTPVSTRLLSDAGAMATLEEFFRLCDEGSECAFAGDSATRFATLAKKLQAKPLILKQENNINFEIGYTELIVITKAYLNYPSIWPDLAQMLAEIESMVSHAAVDPRTAAAIIGTLRRLLSSNGGINGEAYLGVMCSDSDNPREFWAWPVAAWKAEAKHGYFGPLSTWSSSPCAQWKGSGKSRYTGPFSKSTANPILIVSTLYDPATRHESAVTVANLLPGSRLLTVEGWGHGTVFISQCATEIVSDYLLSGALPPEGAVCPPGFTPFDDVPAMASSLQHPFVIPSIEREMLRQMIYH